MQTLFGSYDRFLRRTLWDSAYVGPFRRYPPQKLVINDKPQPWQIAEKKRAERLEKKPLLHPLARVEARRARLAAQKAA